jgi:hypothetical protein
MDNTKFRLGAIMMIALVSTIIGTGVSPILSQRQAFAITFKIGLKTQAPIATSGNNIYIAWWDNKTGNDEVMFRASTDGGKTFGDKINLSNSTKSDSQHAQIEASGDRVFVTWWERNATSNEPLLRTSTDKGSTFGPIMKLGANETIGRSGGG